MKILTYLLLICILSSNLLFADIITKESFQTTQKYSTPIETESDAIKHSLANWPFLKSYTESISKWKVKAELKQLEAYGKFWCVNYKTKRTLPSGVFDHCFTKDGQEIKELTTGKWNKYYLNQLPEVLKHRPLIGSKY